MKIRNLLYCFFILSVVSSASAQVVYQHVQNTTIYEFLDEMAAMKMVDINSAVKPYSRQFIAEQLEQIWLQAEDLNNRQFHELEFFLKDYNKELLRYKEEFDKRFDVFYYADSTFTLNANLILGLTYATEPSKLHRWYGADVFSYLGKNWGAYVSFRDNYESTHFTDPNFLNQRQGGALRRKLVNSDGSQEYSEVRGGLTYAWKWGTVGLVQDQFVWGNNYHGANIFSGRIPSVPQIKLQVKPVRWLEFNSLHAWLNSNIVDSVRTYNYGSGDRIVYRQKYLSANLVTLSPWQHFNFSFGNSTVYGDVPVQPSYLIPFFFHRSLDHSLSNNNNNGGSNSQLFFDMSIRNIRNVHLYGTFFVDELNLSKLFSERNKNQFSFKSGLRLANLLGGNISLIGEYTYTRPVTFRHYIPVTEFTSNDYLLGHYLGENADELYGMILFKPLPRLQASVHYLRARKGERTKLTTGNNQTDLPFLETIEFRQQEVGFRANYELFNDMHLNLQVILSDVTDKTGIYAPAFLEGKTTQLYLTGNWGF